MKPSERIEEIYRNLFTERKNKQDYPLRRDHDYMHSLVQYLDEQYELQQAEKLAETSKWVCPIHGPVWCTCKRPELDVLWVPKLTPEQIEELKKSFEPFKKEIEEKK